MLGVKTLKNTYLLKFTNGDDVEYVIEAADANTRNAYALRAFIQNEILEVDNVTYNLSQLVKYVLKD